MQRNPEFPRQDICSTCREERNRERRIWDCGSDLIDGSVPGTYGEKVRRVFKQFNGKQSRVTAAKRRPEFDIPVRTRPPADMILN